jgi:hypothetical protein
MDLIHIIISVFIGLSGILLIRLGGILLNKKGYKAKLKSYYKHSSLFLLAVILFLYLIEKSFRTHYSNFKLGDNIKIQIKETEIESFLDSPTDYTFSILNLNTNQELTFNYSTNDVYPFKFYLKEENKNQLFINQEGGPVGVYWIVNLKTLKQENRQTEFLEETNFKLIEVATLNHFHKIEPTEIKN